jgi:hypothetical protein
MNKYLVIILLLFSTISCDKKSKVEKEVEEIPVSIKVERFDQAFFETKPAGLQNLKSEFPFFFPAQCLAPGPGWTFSHLLVFLITLSNTTPGDV